jgi:hypothetical protein
MFEGVCETMKVTRVKRIVFPSKTTVKAPKKRFGLPCYDKSICQREAFCPHSDRIVRSERTELEDILGRSGRKVIERQQCDRDCKSRVNLEDVLIKVCRECQFLNVTAGIHLYKVPPRAECFRFILEAMRGAERLPYGRETRIFRRGGGSNWYGGHVVP